MQPADLIAAFDAFESRTRGRDFWPHRVELEPVFHPILAAQRMRRGFIDDARKERLWQRFHLPKTKALPPPEIESPSPKPRSNESTEIADLMVLVPDSFVTKSEPAQRLLAALGGIGPVAFEIVGTATNVWVQLAGAAAEANRIVSAASAFFPEIKIRERPLALVEAWEAAGNYCSALHLGLSERVFRQLRCDSRFDVDPLVEVVAQLDGLTEDEMGVVQILFEPTHSNWRDEFLGFVDSIDDVDQVRPLIERKFSEPPFSVVIRVAALASDGQRSSDIALRLALALHSTTRSAENELIPIAGSAHALDAEALDILNRDSRRSGMILSLSELATLVHLPSAAVRSRRLLRQSITTKAAPAITQGHSLVLGINEHDGDRQDASLSTEQRLRHCYVVGASGTGKSTLLLSMAAQDAASGNGFAVLDPHGDLVEDILARIPVERADDVILFDPSDEEHPVGFNILSAHSELERTLLASDLVAVFKRLTTAWGDVMVSILGNAVLAFLESERGGTLIDLRDFLVDPAFRKKVLKDVRDKEVISYWEREFSLLRGMPQAPVLTRLNGFIRPTLLRRMIAQREDRLDFRQIIDGRKILLAKLSHGAIGAENAHLLGSLLVARITQAAMSRQNIHAASRNPFVCYIDEFHHFVTPSITTILSGARKYGLGLVLAHQELQQLKARSEEVASAVLANAGTRVVFKVSEQDAKTLAEGFTSFDAKDLQRLSVGEAIARVERADFDFNLRTRQSDPVDARTAAARRSVILNASRAKYSVPAADVDRLLEQSSQRDQSVRIKPSDDSHMPQDSAPGRGGPEHKYVQDLVKRLGQERGFVVTIEKRVLDGHGYVDVALERDGLSIGCEISVSTRASHELGNLAKLVAAGFDYAVLITTKERVRTAAKAALGDTTSTRFRFVTPEGFVAFLEDVAPTPRTRIAKSELRAKVVSNERPTGLIASDRAAAYLGLRPQTLAKMRVQGTSPPFHKIGARVLYDVTALDAWIAARTRRSTSDRGD